MTAFVGLGCFKSFILFKTRFFGLPSLCRNVSLYEVVVISHLFYANEWNFDANSIYSLVSSSQVSQGHGSSVLAFWYS